MAFDGVRRLVQKESAAGIVVRVCAETGPDILAAQILVTALKVTAKLLRHLTDCLYVLAND